MLSYEFFCVDEIGKAHLIGIIPERRRQKERITKESVIQRVGTLLGDSIFLNSCFVTKANIDEGTGRITRVTPLFIE